MARGLAERSFLRRFVCSLACRSVSKVRSLSSGKPRQQASFSFFFFFFFLSLDFPDLVRTEKRAADFCETLESVSVGQSLSQSLASQFGRPFLDERTWKRVTTKVPTHCTRRSSQGHTTCRLHLNGTGIALVCVGHGIEPTRPA